MDFCLESKPQTVGTVTNVFDIAQLSRFLSRAIKRRLLKTHVFYVDVAI